MHSVCAPPELWRYVDFTISMQNIQWNAADRLSILVCDEIGEVTALSSGHFIDSRRAISTALVGDCLRIHQVEMIARHSSLFGSLDSSFRCGSRDSGAGTSRAPGHCCSGRPTLELKMFENLRVLAQPGAIISVLLVLLLMAGGDAAILIATKGWPF